MLDGLRRTLRVSAVGEPREPLRVGALWRLMLVGGFLVFATALHAAGLPVPLAVSGILGVQFVVGIAIAIVRARRPASARDPLFLTFALCFDVAIVTAISVYVGGGIWMTTAFYMLAVVFGSSQLRRREALFVGTFGAVAYAALVLTEYLGLVAAPHYFGLPSVHGNSGLAFLLVATNAMALLGAIGMQQSLMRAVERVEGRHRLILESASDMILTLDRDGRFLTLNPVVERETGYRASELEGARWTRFIHRKDVYRWRFAFERGMLGEAGRVEARYRRRDGTRRWVSVAVTPVHEDGTLTHILAVCRDVTDLRDADTDRERLQAQLAHSQKMQAVGQLVSGVAHELNNPLAAILNFTEEMLLDERTDDDREALDIVHQQAQRAKAIVRDLLSFVRQRDDGQSGRQKERLDPAPVLEGIARTQRGEMERVGVSLHVDVAMGMGLVEIDRAGLEQVVTNLLVNALQSVRRGGNIWLSGSRAGKRYLIVVEDDGPGMPASVLPHIFDPFFTTKPTGEGTGLGLSVSLGIVEQYGGTLRASNLGDADDAREPAPDVTRRTRGARFVIELPVSPPNGGVQARVRPGEETPALTRAVAAPAAPAAPAAAAVDAGAAARAPGAAIDGAAAAAERREPRRTRPAVPGAERFEPGSGCRVLIIDDEESIRRVVRRFLERRGCLVEDAVDGEMALSRLLDSSRPAFDLILCDLNMPRLSGMDLHDRLVRQAPELTRGLVFSTGDTVAPWTTDFLARSDRPVLEKPFELSRLGALLDDCLMTRG